MAKFDYNQFVEQEKNKDTGGNYSRVSYLALKNDGDEAVVRFMYDSPAQFDLETVHNVQIDGRYRKVTCLRESAYAPLEQCPLCANKEKVYQKFYVKLIEYVRNEQNEIVPVARVWERPANFASVLKGYFDEGYVLSECIFKIKRRGKAGDMQTTYDVVPANPAVYKPEFYPKDTSLFEGYSLYSYVVLNKTYEELDNFTKGVPLTGNTQTNSSNSNSAPAASQPVAPAPIANPGYTQPQAPAAQPTVQHAYTPGPEAATAPVTSQPNYTTYNSAVTGAPVYTSAQPTSLVQPAAQPQAADAAAPRPGRRYTY